jgi:hypothetical protein
MGSFDRSPNSILQSLRPDTHPLSIYLNDHLMGASAGVELFRRATGSAYPEHRTTLGRLTDEVAEDRDTLITIMRRVDVPVRSYRIAAGWVGEKIGRLKPNGHIVRRAPLSHLIEVETMLLGVRGKTAGWQALRSLTETEHRLSPDQLDELLHRAHDQQEQLEAIRLDLATRVLQP